jgi:hypothetical protein
MEKDQQVTFTLEEIGYILYTLTKYYLNNKSVRDICRMITAKIKNTDNVQKE